MPFPTLPPLKTTQTSNGDNLEQIYQSTRMLCRTLRRYPNAMETLLASSMKNPRPQSGILFNQYLSDLTGVMYRRLSTTVEEEVRVCLSVTTVSAVKKHRLDILTLFSNLLKERCSYLRRAQEHSIGRMEL